MIIYVIVGIIAYLIGSINFSIILSKKMAGFDIREKGSGNAGSTNMLRSVGKKAAILTLICDILKGVVAVLIAIFIGNISTNYFDSNIENYVLVEIAALLVILGHTFPVFFKFKGGKGIATSLGVLMVINWQIGLICLVFALILMILTKIVSVGSIAAAILFPVLTLFLSNEYFICEGKYFVFSILLAILVCFNHRENIKRLMNGTENKISFKKQ